jgi:hypothetical protein
MKTRRRCPVVSRILPVSWTLAVAGRGAKEPVAVAVLAAPVLSVNVAVTSTSVG